MTNILDFPTKLADEYERTVLKNFSGQLYQVLIEAKNNNVKPDKVAWHCTYALVRFLLSNTENDILGSSAIICEGLADAVASNVEIESLPRLSLEEALHNPIFGSLNELESATAILTSTLAERLEKLQYIKEMLTNMDKERICSDNLDQLLENLDFD